VNDLVCPRCRASAATGPVYPPRCACGGLWDAAEPAPRPPRSHAPRSPWPDPVEEDLVWMREDLGPTGSFKDRGAEALIRVAEAAGAVRLTVDSSGSAALAAARAAAAAGLPLSIHTPGDLPATRSGVLRAFGAVLTAAGSRADAARRAETEAQEAFWFSHVMHPAFLVGTAESGFDALESGEVPGIWVVPVGNGSLFLGLDRALRATGAEAELLAVQAANCPGLRGGPVAPSRARGIAVADPPRRDAVLEAVARRRGRVLEVEEEEIAAAEGALARRGVMAEAASAAALAGVRRLRGEGRRDPVLAWLTGSGSRG